MTTDPFAEPTDAEKTVIRPRPSGTAAGGRAQPHVAAMEPTARDLPPVPKTGPNPLVAAAAPVLAAATRVASVRENAPDPERFRAAMVDTIRGFETDALATGLDTRSLRAARYALCAMLDDLVLSTPWGRASSWMQQSITSIFHNEVIGGERVFEILEQMQTSPGRHAEVVELIYLCTSLGFEGRYRVMPRGSSGLAELRDGVYRTIRQRRGEFERELSPHWQGVAAGARGLARRVPLWALGVGTLAITAAMYVAFTFLLANESDIAFAELYALPPREPLPVMRGQPVPQEAAPVVAAAAQVPLPASKIRRFLEPEIKVGLVEVYEDPQTIVVHLVNGNMFASGQAMLGKSYPQLLHRIGDALETEPGSVVVKGYTDNQPIRTVRFPSNFELSQARAEAVAAMLRSRLSDPKRVRAEGRGEAEPLADNATAEGRLQNRRTEIVVVRPSSAQ
jgi:type VI secretion system protein ImpK